MHAEIDTLISIDEFKKLDIRIGRILAAEPVPATDKLYRLLVDLGEGEARTIVSGIRGYIPDPAELISVQTAFVANLEPRLIKGIESKGMLLAAGGEDFALIVPAHEVTPGARLG